MLKQSRLVGIPAQWFVCQEFECHLSHTIRQGMTEDSWLMLWLKKWISAPDANLEYCRCLLVRWYTRSAFPVPKMRPGIFCTQKGILTHIFYPVKTTGDRSSVCMQNYAHLKQLPLDKQQIGVSGARIFAHLRVGNPDTSVLSVFRTSRCAWFPAPETPLT